jgi:uncharacterized glyoxalase superfamily protein PhnB
VADWRPQLIPAISYLDPRAAIAWLERAFGFELVMLIEDAEGRVVHSEMRFGDAAVMIGAEWSDDHRSPRSVGGKNTRAYTSRSRPMWTPIANGPAPPAERS